MKGKEKGAPLGQSVVTTAKWLVAALFVGAEVGGCGRHMWECGR